MLKDQHYSLADDVCTEVAASPATEDKANTSLDRRDFLKYFSASVALASSSCVRRPAEHAIPYVNQPVDQVPGVAVHYATTCTGCAAGCGINVKTREGRPVKIEGNPDHAATGGALCPMGQASLQGLYHPERRAQPLIKRGTTMEKVSWDDVYLHLKSRLNTNKVGIFTSGTTGHRAEFLQEFLQKLGAPATNLYRYEPNLLYTHVANAHQQSFGRYVIPRVDFTKAEVIVGIGSDFLDQGLAKVAYAKNFSAARDLKRKHPAQLVQFEASLSLTGARADERIVIAPGEEINVAFALAQALYQQPQAQGGVDERKHIAALLQQHQVVLAPDLQKNIAALAAQLVQKPAVVLCGGSHNFDANAQALQQVAIAINILCGAYENVLDVQHGWQVPPVGNDDLQRFARDAEQLEVLFIIDSNPSFTLPACFWFCRENKKHQARHFHASLSCGDR